MTHNKINNNINDRNLVEFWTRNLRYLVFLSGLFSLSLMYYNGNFSQSFGLLIICYVLGIVILWLDSPKYAKLKYVLEFFIWYAAVNYVFPGVLNDSSRYDLFVLWSLWLILFILSLLTRKAAKALIVFYNLFLKVHIQKALNTLPSSLKSLASTIGVQWALVTLNISLWLSGPILNSINYISDKQYQILPNSLADPMKAFFAMHGIDPIGNLKDFIHFHSIYIGLLIFLLIGLIITPYIQSVITKYLQSILDKYLKLFHISDIFDIILIISLAVFVITQPVVNQQDLIKSVLFKISLSFLIFSLTIKLCAWRSIGRWPAEMADLSVSVKGSRDFVSPGERTDYLMEVRNLGPSKARSVLVENAIFGGKIVEVRSTDMEVSFKECKASCFLKELDAGKSSFITLSVDAGMPPEFFIGKLVSKVLNYTQTPNNYNSNNIIINKAKVSSATYDPNSSNNGCEAPLIQIKEESDLSIQMDVSKEKALPGEIITYELSVFNHGPSKARKIIVKFPMKDEIDYVSTEPKTEKYDPINGIWSFDELDQNGTRPIKISVRIRSIRECVFENSAEVSSAVHDPNTSNNIAERPVSVLPLSHPEINPIDHPGSIFSGDPIKYTIIVTNKGPSNAKDIKIRTFLPKGSIFNDAKPRDEYDESEGIWHIGPLADQDHKSLELEVGTDGLVPGSIAEMKITVLPSPDLQVSEILPVETEIKRIAHLSLEIMPKEINAFPGDEISYNIYLINNGPSTAKDIKVNILIPDGIEQIEPYDKSYDPKQSLWYLDEFLPLGENYPKILKINAKVKRIHETDLAVFAKVNSDADDPKKPNEPSKNKTHILPLAELIVDPIDHPESVFPGDPIKYVITVTNKGPSPVKDIEISTDLPKGTIYKNPSKPLENYNPSERKWHVRNLERDEYETLELIVDTPKDRAGYPAEMKVILLTKSSDKFQINHVAPEPVITRINEAADLILKMMEVPHDVYPGDLITYNLEIMNSGPSEARGITVNITKPKDTEDYSCSPETPFHVKDNVSWHFEKLAVNNKINISLMVKVACVDETYIKCTAEVNSLVPNRNKNTIEYRESHVNPSTYLIVGLPKKSNNNPKEAVLIVSAINKGPSDAKNVKINISVPKKVKYEQIVPTINSKYDPSNSIWHLEELAKYGNEELTLRVIIHEIFDAENIQATIIHTGTYNLNKNNKSETRRIGPGFVAEIE